MNEHDTVVPSSRRVVGLLFPGELLPLLVVALICGSPSGVTCWYGLPVSGFAGSGQSGPDRVVCRPVLIDPGAMEATTAVRVSGYTWYGDDSPTYLRQDSSRRGG